MDKTLVAFALGLAFLPIAVALILIRATPLRDHHGLFSFVCYAAVLGWIALFILWTQRGYARRWQQFRARSWQELAGKFDEGEIVTMRKGRSGKITGYQVWLGYDYFAGGEQSGLYILPFVGEFPTEEVAEKCRRKAGNRDVAVRVSPLNPKRSCVLDQDVRLLIGEPNQPIDH